MIASPNNGFISSVVTTAAPFFGAAALPPFASSVT